MSRGRGVNEMDLSQGANATSLTSEYGGSVDGFENGVFVPQNVRMKEGRNRGPIVTLRSNVIIDSHADVPAVSTSQYQDTSMIVSDSITLEEEPVIIKSNSKEHGEVTNFTIPDQKSFAPGWQTDKIVHNSAESLTERAVVETFVTPLKPESNSSSQDLVIQIPDQGHVTQTQQMSCLARLPVCNMVVPPEILAMVEGCQTSMQNQTDIILVEEQTGSGEGIIHVYVVPVASSVDFPDVQNQGQVQVSPENEDQRMQHVGPGHGLLGGDNSQRIFSGQVPNNTLTGMTNNIIVNT